MTIADFMDKHFVGLFTLSLLSLFVIYCLGSDYIGFKYGGETLEDKEENKS